VSYDPNGRPQSREVFEPGQSVPLAWEYSHYNGNGEREPFGAVYGLFLSQKPASSGVLATVQTKNSLALG
jgi:hypothetical protein